MDDIEDGARYPPNPYGVSHQQGYGSSNRQKLPLRNVPHSRPIGNQYVDDDEDEEEEDVEDLGEEEENHYQNNGVRYVGKDIDDDDDDDDDDDELDDDEEEEDDEGGDKQNGFNQKNDDVALERHPKKRKLKSLVSSYEFAPRVPAPAPSVPKPSYGGRNSLTDWTERETFVLLDAWGDRFLQRGRKSLRSEEWQEVAEKVSEVSNIDRTDTQCRNRLDTLKKKYKKEKVMLAETGAATTSKWVYCKKMDMLMSTPPQQGGLSCGLDSGEYVFMNPRVYLNRANGLDEMRDSPPNSESADGEEDVSDGLPPKKRRFGRQCDEVSSFRLLADSIQNFSDIYEKIENSKRQQMLELEKMRMDFQMELEMQKRQIMERMQAEIAKMQQGDDEENDVSAENASG